MGLIRLYINWVFRYSIAAGRWEGWGREGDPRSKRPELTYKQWREGGFPPEPLRPRRKH